MSTCVVCICGADDFPFGNGTASRVLALGRVAQAAGIRFSVLQWGLNTNAANSKARGSHQGIDFEYLAQTARRPKSGLSRKLLNLFGLCILFKRLLTLSQEPCCIYLVMQHWSALLVIGLCRMLRIPIVQEVGEWWQGVPESPASVRWYCAGPMLTCADGLITPSLHIHRRLAADARPTVRKKPLLYLPSLLDLHIWSDSSSTRPAQEKEPTVFAWCGFIHGYLNDVFFMVRAMARIHREGKIATLVIIGNCSDEIEARIRNFSASLGLPETALQFTGYITDNALRTYLASANALLLPLWNDDRSVTRLPNKAAQYLSSGTPMISSNIGEMAELLTHGENAFLSEPGDLESFAANMISVIDDPGRARQIGFRGRGLCEDLFNYERYTESLDSFFGLFMKNRDVKLTTEPTKRSVALK